MIKPKPKRCKYCGEEYTPFNSLTPCHTAPECAVKWLKDNPDKAKKNRLKVERKELKDLKEKGMTRSDYLKLAQIAFNTYIRHRDKDQPCISCGRKLNAKFDAGHFYSVGAFPNLRFEELNNHAQCVQCNRDKSGNLLEYREGLISRIGQEKFDELEAMKRVEKHYSIDQIKEIIKIYKAKIK
jgi:hypothetical protein